MAADFSIGSERIDDADGTFVPFVHRDSSRLRAGAVVSLSMDRQPAEKKRKPEPVEGASEQPDGCILVSMINADVRLGNWPTALVVTALLVSISTSSAQSVGAVT